MLKIEPSSILGGGGFGVVLKTQNNQALKLIKNINECESLKQEIYIHKKIEEILRDITKVPHIYETFENIVTVIINDKKTTYLCGILMEKIEALEFPDSKEFCQFHPAFGLELEQLRGVRGVGNIKRVVDALVKLGELQRCFIGICT